MGRGGDVGDEASNEGKEPDIAKVCELLDAGTDVQYERCVYPVCVPGVDLVVEQEY